MLENALQLFFLSRLQWHRLVLGEQLIGALLGA